MVVVSTARVATTIAKPGTTTATVLPRVPSGGMNLPLVRFVTVLKRGRLALLQYESVTQATDLISIVTTMVWVASKYQEL